MKIYVTLNGIHKIDKSNLNVEYTARWVDPKFLGKKESMNFVFYFCLCYLFLFEAPDLQPPDSSENYLLFTKYYTMSWYHVGVKTRCLVTLESVLFVFGIRWTKLWHQ